MRTTLLICEHGELSGEILGDLAASDTEIGRYILATTNAEKQVQRTASYLVIRGLLSDEGITLSDLRHGTHGEPIAVIDGGDSEFYVSISHHGDLTAIAISGKRVGVDIECELAPERARRIDTRFLDGRGIESATRGIDNIELILAHLDKGGTLFITDRLSPERVLCELVASSAEYVNNNLHIDECDPFGCTEARWTSLEAILKIFGRGFADFLNTGATAKHSRLASYKIKRGGEHLFVTVGISDRH